MYIKKPITLITLISLITLIFPLNQVSASLSGSILHTTDADFNAGAHGPPAQTQVTSNNVTLKKNIDLGGCADSDAGTTCDSSGTITVSSASDLNAVSISGRGCADAKNYNVTTLNSGSATINGDPTGCIAAGDEVMLINLKGIAASYDNVGNYEFLRVQSITSNSVTFTGNKAKLYGNNGGDTNIGTTNGTNQIVMLQRVPSYTNLTINTGGSITASAWNGTKGGVIAFRAYGTTTINVANGINAAGLGYVRGAGVAYNQNAGGGETYNGTAGSGGTNTTAGNSGQGGGGGGGSNSGTNYGGANGALGGGGGGSGGKYFNGGTYTGGGGGGGGGSVGLAGSSQISAGNGSGANGGNGSAANGGDWGASGAGGGGGSDGRADSSGLNSKIYMGSGGGGTAGCGGYNWDLFCTPYGNPGCVYATGVNGGAGGGISIIVSNNLQVAAGASIATNGNNGSNGISLWPNYSGSGGGGGGGSIALVTNILTNSGGITADGGNGGTVNYPGGAGGGGRTYVAYAYKTPGSIDPVPNYYETTTIPASYIANYYYSTGTYTSAIFQRAQVASWGNIAWTKTGTGTITMKARTCTNSDCSDANRDWTANCTAITSDQAISTGNCADNSQKYVQYQATLGGDTVTTPSLDDVTLDYLYNPDTQIFSGVIQFFGTILFK